MFSQGCTKSWATGCVKMRWISCVLLPASRWRNAMFPQNFTQPSLQYHIPYCTAAAAVAITMMMLFSGHYAYKGLWQNLQYRSMYMSIGPVTSCYIMSMTACHPNHHVTHLNRRWKTPNYAQTLFLITVLCGRKWRLFHPSMRDGTSPHCFLFLQCHPPSIRTKRQSFK